jgi:hypothetical protein
LVMSLPDHILFLCSKCPCFTFLNRSVMHVQIASSRMHTTTTSFKYSKIRVYFTVFLNLRFLLSEFYLLSIPDSQ